jgi:hypothetical protein
MFNFKDLKRFADLSLKRKKFTDTHLGIKVRRDISSKPVQQLREVLDCVGLDYWRAEVRVVAGEKYYSYRLNPNTLALMKNVLTVQDKARRRQVGADVILTPVAVPSVHRKKERLQRLKRISGSILV